MKLMTPKLMTPKLRCEIIFNRYQCIPVFTLHIQGSGDIVCESGNSAFTKDIFFEVYSGYVDKVGESNLQVATVEFKDVVSYSNLTPGKEYTLKSELHMRVEVQFLQQSESSQHPGFLQWSFSFLCLQSGSSHPQGFLGFWRQGIRCQ